MRTNALDKKVCGQGSYTMRGETGEAGYEMSFTKVDALYFITVQDRSTCKKPVNSVNQWTISARCGVWSLLGLGHTAEIFSDVSIYTRHPSQCTLRSTMGATKKKSTAHRPSKTSGTKPASKAGVEKKRKKNQKFRDAELRDRLDRADLSGLSAKSSADKRKAFQTEIKAEKRMTNKANDDLLHQLDIIEKFEL